jgi:hypothetical protein
MRGREAVLSILILLSFSLPPIASAQCPWTPRYSGQFRTTALDVSVDGNFVWLATGYGVQLLEKGADGQTAIVDSVAIPGATRVIEADGNGLAYAGSGARLYVLRREGKSIRVIRGVTTSGVVNDVAISSYLFVATSAGIDHFDRFDPENPVKTSAFLSTSSPNVTSLALDGAKLYAADGDTTLETFSLSIPSIPQNTGSISTVRATSVHVTSDGLVLASDNIRRSSELFSGSTRLAQLPFAAMSFAPSAQGQFLAGPDRTVLAVDLTNPARVAELFETQLSPTDGSDNTIHAIERSGNTLYVAAGDIGLVIFDVASIARPWPVVSYTAGSTTSVRVAGDKAWFSNAAGTIFENRIVATGLALNEERTWSAGAGAVVRDVQDQTLLTTSGAVATIWSLAGTPSTTGTTMFAAGVSNAVLRGSGIVAILADGSLWTAQPSAAPVKVTLPKIALLARNGTAIALAEVNETTGKTTVHYYATGDLSAEPRRFTIDGAPVGNLALGTTRAAIFTFAGITVFDLASGAASVAVDSNRIIPSQLALSGTTLLAADNRTLLVYEDAHTLARQQLLPASVVALDAASPVAVMATSEGTAAASFFGHQPESSTPFRSTFYAKVVAGSDRVYLSGDDGIDIFRTATNDVLEFLAGIRAQGIIDVAATDSALFTLGASGIVTSYSPTGTPLAQFTIDEGADAQPRGIAAAGKAVWVSLSKGCTSGTCEKKTLVLDPVSLIVTASMTGAVIDVVTSGTRAYALFDLPNEVRVLNIADPLHPAPLASAVRPASAASIAASNGKVYVLGDKVYSYAEATLTPAGDFLAAVAPSETTRIRIEGNCAIVTGRSDNAEKYVLPNFTGDGALVEMPSAVRSFVLQPGRVVLLTGHSVELWATGPAVTPSKRRATR